MLAYQLVFTLKGVVGVAEEGDPEKFEERRGPGERGEVGAYMWQCDNSRVICVEGKLSIVGVIDPLIGQNTTKERSKALPRNSVHGSSAIEGEEGGCGG